MIEMKLDFNIFETLLEPCVIIDRELQVVYCNETASVLFGVPVRKILRSKCKLNVLVEFTTPLEALLNLEKITSPFPVEELVVKTPANGNNSRIQVSIQPLIDEQAESFWILFIRDVTLEERLQNKYKDELEQKESIIIDLKESKKIIEDYSSNLEKKVHDRTQELRELNKTFSAMLDSLNDGFFIFDREGVCLPVYSRACEDILECNPAGRSYLDILDVQYEDRNKVKEWIEFLFEEVLPFEEAVLFGPSSRTHSEGKNIELNYYPIRGTNGKLQGVVVVASDTTSLLEARQEAEHEKTQVKLVLNILRNRKQIHNFIEDCRKIIKNLKTEIEKSPILRNLPEVFRGLHTLKGGAASIGVTALSERCHATENILAELKLHQTESEEFLQKWKRIEYLIRKIEEDFLNFLDNTAQLIGKSLSSERILEIPVSRFYEILNTAMIAVAHNGTREFLIQEFLMEPVVELVKGFQESLTELAIKLRKELLPIEFRNGHIRVLADHYKDLFSTFVHIFRNAIDHGIELPEKRRELGKPQSGKITVEFQQSHERLRVTVTDDGAGINSHGIRSKLIKNGIDVSKETDEQVIQHIFDLGFSTRDQVSTISGRGVGMDAVMQAAIDLGGTVRVSSFLNQGASFIIDVPYIRNVETRTHPSKGIRIAK
jgi:two-component system chemotaxis sensor kinase CheA